LLAADAAAATVPLARIRGIRSLTALLENEPALLDSVRAAKRDHESWDAIADAAGLKPAAAKWRWQGNDEEIAARHEQGRTRSRTGKPDELPGMSVAEAAAAMGVGVQAIYQQVTRGTLRAETVEANGRSYKRVFPEPVDQQLAEQRPVATKADLPGVSVSEAAAIRRVTSQAIYQLIARGKLESVTVEQNGHTYKRVLGIDAKEYKPVETD
jgi:transposase